jgi:hypothetical protein
MDVDKNLVLSNGRRRTQNKYNNYLTYLRVSHSLTDFNIFVEGIAGLYDAPVFQLTYRDFRPHTDFPIPLVINISPSLDTRIKITPRVGGVDFLERRCPSQTDNPSYIFVWTAG